MLGRITGVQIRRENGEANSVVIRGLPGLVTLLNGREMFTSSGRNLYLADIPAAMLYRVDVYKTQGAEMVEGGTMRRDRRAHQPSVRCQGLHLEPDGARGKPRQVAHDGSERQRHGVEPLEN
ncbi:Plug domain-containing protein [Massilia sp. H-1]|nr:Plug domain-containing protein [Massilia sp. H-1]